MPTDTTKRKKSQIDLSVIDALVELERLGVEVTQAGEGEIKCRCPVPSHNDATPSVTLNIHNKLWVCQSAACTGKGDIVSFIAHHQNLPRKSVLDKLSERYDLGTATTTIKMEVVEAFHSKIWSNSERVELLLGKGIDRNLITTGRLGIDKSGRITIPIFDAKGKCVNVRRYLPGAVSSEKFKNTTGAEAGALYLPKQLQFPTIWLCGGELKALAATKYLNQNNIGAVAPTSGEGSWKHDHTKFFKDKKIYICMDIDAGGIKAAAKYAKILCQVAEVFVVHLPLDKEKYPTGDLTDWIVEGVTSDSFLKLMSEAKGHEVVNIQKQIDELPEKTVTLQQSTDSASLGHKISFPAVITMLDETPYAVPKDVQSICSLEEKFCHECPLRWVDRNKEGWATSTINPLSPHLLEMMDTTDKAVEQGIKSALGIPKCPSVRFEEKTNYTVYDTRLSPELKYDAKSSEHVVQPAYLFSSKQPEQNIAYNFAGRVLPKPNSRQLVLLLDEYETCEDNLSSFDLDGCRDSLKIFRPDEWTVESIQEKLDVIYSDIEVNVTRIFKRRSLHLLFDLAWHSVLHFEFEKQVHTGWVNLLVVGDSSQGKSEASLRLLHHYKSGARFDCKNSTVAGLLGGCTQSGNRWFVSWGAIPQNDRGLCILEEFKGASEQTISALTDMRSSGVANITKIEKRQAHARTRLVFISNPADSRSVSEYSFGVEIMEQLIPGKEDIRRFDIATVVSKDEIDASELNTLLKDREQFEHIFTSELCTYRVLFAWTRTADQVKFDEDAVAACVYNAGDLCTKFSEALPLIDMGTTKFKLAKLAASLAAMTFSEDGSGNLVVRRCHVDFVTAKLIEVYSSEVVGYLEFSHAYNFANSLSKPHLVKKKLLGTRYPAPLIEQLIATEKISMTDLMDWCELDYETGRKLITFLVLNRAISRNKKEYEKSAGFIKLLKQMQRDNPPETTVVDEDDEI